MTFRLYVYSMIITTLICWGAFCVVLFRFDPVSAGFIGFLLFFLALFFALWGTVSIVGVGLRTMVKRQSMPYQHIAVSLRQALWFALTLCMSLFLMTQGLFTWWIVSTFIIALISFEALFLARSVQGGYATKTSHNSYHRRKRAQS